jgi:hypothetical protein
MVNQAQSLITLELVRYQENVAIAAKSKLSCIN